MMIERRGVQEISGRTKTEFSILRVTSVHDIQTNPFFKSYNIVLNATFRIAYRAGRRHRCPDHLCLSCRK